MSKSKTTELVVDPEFAAFLPPQTPEELSKLEEGLLADGCLDPIKAHTETGIVLDGHTRKRLCEKHDIKYRVEWISIPGDRDAAIDWVIGFQMGRRNLNDTQKSYLRGKEYLAKKKTVGRPVTKNESFSLNGDGGDHQIETVIGKTVEAMADKHKVSTATIQRDAEFTKSVDALPKDKKVAVLTEEKSAPSKAEVIAAAKATKPKRATKGKKGKKSGKVFPWADFDKTYGRLVRATDEIAKFHDSVKSNEHRAALKLLADYENMVKGWRGRLEAKQKQKS